MFRKGEEFSMITVLDRVDIDFLEREVFGFEQLHGDVLGDAVLPESWGCENSCYGSCTGGCTGTCFNTCYGGCTGTCTGQTIS